MWHLIVHVYRLEFHMHVRHALECKINVMTFTIPCQFSQCMCYSHILSSCSKAQASVQHADHIMLASAHPWSNSDFPHYVTASLR